jgi:hypothetical protein
MSVARWDLHQQRNVARKQLLTWCSCRGNHTTNYCVHSNLKETKAAPEKASLEHRKLSPVQNRVLHSSCFVITQATTFPTTTTSNTGRPTERQAAPMGGQCKPACPEVSTVESQTPRSKQVDSIPSHRFSHCSSELPISWETFPSQNYYS